MLFFGALTVNRLILFDERRQNDRAKRRKHKRSELTEDKLNWVAQKINDIKLHRQEWLYNSSMVVKRGLVMDMEKTQSVDFHSRKIDFEQRATRQRNPLGTPRKSGA